MNKPVSAQEPTRSARDVAQSLQRLREARKGDKPTLALRKAFTGNAAGLQRLMELRQDRTLRTTFALELRSLKQTQRGGSVAAMLWPEIIRHPDLIAQSTPVLTRGVLTVFVPSHAVKFAIDRLLRAGGQTELLRALPVGVHIKRIVLKVGHTPQTSIDTPAEDWRLKPAPDPAQDDADQ